MTVDVRVETTLRVAPDVVAAHAADPGRVPLLEERA
ncbi:MAG: hypothetical protein QOK15_521 [Nocardioidaceae bacterium]|nr:hypothetical protein [Nocardioidaceae bacterium]